MKTNALTVSVIIPTYNRPKSLMRLLDGLAAQSYPLPLIEVIVVVEVIVTDGSKDATIQMLENYQSNYSLQYIISEGTGPTIKRNEGSRKAKGTLLLFIDDDIDPSKGLIEAHVSAHYKPNKVVIGYLPFVIENKAGFFSIKLRSYWEDKFQDMGKPGYRYSYEDLISGNFSVSSKMFNKENGFDTNLPIREDYELGMRLIKSGAQFDFSFEAWGYHRDEVTNLTRSLKRKRVEGGADVQFSRLHPQLIKRFDLYHYRSSLSTLGALRLLIIFNAPILSDILASAIKQSMSLLEWLRFRSIWSKLSIKLHGYWYLRGVSEHFTSRKSLTKYIKDKLPNPDTEVDLIIDLKKGIAEAEQQLDMERPESVQLLYGDYTIGSIDPIPGAERLRGEHLKKALATEYSLDLLKILTLDQKIKNMDRKEISK